MSPAPAPPALPDRPRTRRAVLRLWLGRFGPLLGLAAVWTLFAILLRNDNFMVWENQRLMLLQTSIVGIAAVGATLVIVSGGIDLSVGSTIALGTVVIAMLLKAGAPPLVAGLGGVLVGTLVGAAIGSMVIGHVGAVAAFLAAAGTGAWLGGLLGGSPWLTVPLAIAFGTAAGLATASARRTWVPLSPFIVTLALWGGLRGIAKGLAENQPIYIGASGSGWLSELMKHDPSGPFSIAAPGAWIMLAVAVATGLMLRHTRFGRHVYAIGSNEETARLCGVRVDRRKIGIYAFASSCAGLAAVLQFSFLTSMGDPTTADGYELRVIAAVVIGGASLTGGEGSVLGTIVGALIMAVVDNGCTKLGLEDWVQDIVTGAIILGAVVVDRLRHR